MSSKLLLDDPPLVVQPQLAVAIGLNEAIVLQQVHYWIEQNRRANRHIVDGCVWTYNSVPEWVSQFPFWSERTIWQTLKNLRKSGLLIAEMHAKDKRDRTLWYTISYQEFEKLTTETAEAASPIPQDLRDASLQDLRDVYKETETSTETSTEREAKPKKNELAETSEVPAASVTARSLSQADDETSAEARAFAQMSGKRDPLLEKLEAERFFRRLLTQDVVTHPQVQPNLQSWFQFHGPEKLEAYKKAAFKQNERPPVFFFVDLCKGTRKLSTSLITSSLKTPPPRESLYKPGDMVLVGESELEIADVDPVGNWVMFREHGPVRPDMCCPL